MGKKRKFNRFIRWIKSDLPSDNKSVLLLGVTKLPSPTPIRSRPHTLHLDHHPQKAQTLDNQPHNRNKLRLCRSHSGDSLNELFTAKVINIESKKTLKKVQFEEKSHIKNDEKKSCLNSTCFDKKLGYCTEQPYDYYHPIPDNNRGGDVTFMMDKSVDSIGSCSLDVDASSTDFSDSSVGSSDCTLRSLGIPTPTTQPSTLPSFRLNTENFDLIETKKPSYLNLACTVNGYSNITNYDSKLRENFRIPRSREVSPIRPLQNNAPPEIHQKSDYLTPKMSESKSQIMRSSQQTYYSSKKIIYSSNSIEYINGQNGGGDKSFIQQRVERLYGPGALAQGFFISKRTKSRTSESENTSNTTSNTSVIEESEVNIKQSTSSPQLPVLRHLRPEFRAQLPILSPKKTDSLLKSTTVPLSLNGFTENKENLTNLTGKTVKLTDIITEEIPAAPRVLLPSVLPSVNGHKLNGQQQKKKEEMKDKKEEIKDGNYFLKILKQEQERLLAMAHVAELEIDANLMKMNDEQLGYLRSASGKARLLVNQKMKQFEGLCHKNINKVVGEQFPTTPEDLQGFWDMVMLQVVQIDELFKELDRIRANNWIIEEKPKPGVSENGSKPPTTTTTTKKLVIIKKPISAKAEEERKQREALRKKMIEDRRKLMRAKQQNQSQQEEKSIEIFVPETTTTTTTS